MNLNELLRNTKTARVERPPTLPFVSTDHVAPPAEAMAGEDVDSPRKSRRSAGGEGLNLKDAQEELARQRNSASAIIHQEREHAELVSEQEAARVAHQVLDYVLRKELGGRHNASRGGYPPTVPRSARIAAEHARWCPAAGYSLVHVVPSTVLATSSTVDSLFSVVEKERLTDGVRAMRASLQVCDAEWDLVGGVCAGTTPQIRQHVRAVIECGLRGDAWERDGVSSTMAITSHGDADGDKGPASVMLFHNTAASSTDGAAKSSKCKAATLSGFSLTAFLADGDSSTTASDTEA